MRTTLDLDEDVLQAAKSLSRVKKTTIGKVISALARSALTHTGVSQTKNGVPLFPRHGNEILVTLDLVNRLRDESL